MTIGKVVGGKIAAAHSITSLALLSAASAESSPAPISAPTPSPPRRSAHSKSPAAVSNSLIGAGYDPDTDTVTGGAASIIRIITIRKIDAATRFAAGKFKTATFAGKPVKKISADPHFQIL